MGFNTRSSIGSLLTATRIRRSLAGSGLIRLQTTCEFHMPMKLCMQPWSGWYLPLGSKNGSITFNSVTPSDFHLRSRPLILTGTIPCFLVCNGREMPGSSPASLWDVFRWRALGAPYSMRWAGGAGSRWNCSLVRLPVQNPQSLRRMLSEESSPGASILRPLGNCDT